MLYSDSLTLFLSAVCWSSLSLLSHSLLAGFPLSVQPAIFAYNCIYIYIYIHIYSHVYFHIVSCLLLSLIVRLTIVSGVRLLVLHLFSINLTCFNLNSSHLISIHFNSIAPFWLTRCLHSLYFTHRQLQFQQITIPTDYRLQDSRFPILFIRLFPSPAFTFLPSFPTFTFSKLIFTFIVIFIVPLLFHLILFNLI